MVYSSLWLVENWTVNQRMKIQNKTLGQLLCLFQSVGICYVSRRKENDKVSTEKISAIKITANPEWLLQSEPIKFMYTVLPRESIAL